MNAIVQSMLSYVLMSAVLGISVLFAAVFIILNLNKEE